MHRKTRRFQWRHLVTAILLAALTVTLAVAAVLAGQPPAAASAPWPGNLASAMARDAVMVHPVMLNGICAMQGVCITNPYPPN